MIAGPVDSRALEALLAVGGAAFAAQMLGIYLTHTPERIAAVRGAGRDPVAAGRAAHSLRSGALQFGALEVGGLAGEAERALAAGQVHDGPALAARLEAAHAGYVEWLRASGHLHD